LTTEKLDAAQLNLLRRRLLAKGSEINERLTRLMAGENFDIGRLLEPQPGETPIERLRRFLMLIDERLQAIRAGRYGVCERCGAPMSFAALEQVPWATTCARCAAG